MLDRHGRPLATGMTPERHPFSLLRDKLRRAGIRSVDELASAEPGRRLTVAGLITHRQRPGTASGITFLNLEDETGMLNVVCSVGVWRRRRRAASTAPATSTDPGVLHVGRVVIEAQELVDLAGWTHELLGARMAP
ncbi:MAG: hypothetical protein ACRCSN_06080 [Dermatophilaceae bacterium]